jgi:hypothetical protein
MHVFLIVVDLRNESNHVQKGLQALRGLTRESQKLRDEVVATYI